MCWRDMIEWGDSTSDIQGSESTSLPPHFLGQQSQQNGPLRSLYSRIRAPPLEERNVAPDEFLYAFDSVNLISSVGLC